MKKKPMILVSREKMGKIVITKEMNSKTKQIQGIRAKCIAANPEIVELKLGSTVVLDKRKMVYVGDAIGGYKHASPQRNKKVTNKI